MKRLVLVLALVPGCTFNSVTACITPLLGSLCAEIEPKRFSNVPDPGYEEQFGPEDGDDDESAEPVGRPMPSMPMYDPDTDGWPDAGYIGPV